MRYPESFARKAKQLFPGWTELHEAIERGNVLVGRFLSDAATDSIYIDIVLSATSLEELQEYARQERAKAKLYHVWYELYQRQRTSYPRK